MSTSLPMNQTAPISYGVPMDNGAPTNTIRPLTTNYAAARMSPASSFSAPDRNGDGVITRAEFMQTQPQPTVIMQAAPQPAASRSVVMAPPVMQPVVSGSFVTAPPVMQPVVSGSFVTAPPSRGERMVGERPISREELCSTGRLLEAPAVIAERRFEVPQPQPIIVQPQAQPVIVQPQPQPVIVQPQPQHVIVQPQPVMVQREAPVIVQQQAVPVSTFSSLDRNGDGVITRAEFQQAMGAGVRAMQARRSVGK